MNDKNILIAIEAGVGCDGIIRFADHYLKGANLKAVLCVMYSKNPLDAGFEAQLEQFATVFQNRNIPLTIRHFTRDPWYWLEKNTAFADLLIIEKSSLIPSALSDEFVKHGCSMIVVPAQFYAITNVLLIHDGTDPSLKNIKQFCQLFAGALAQKDLTLLMVTPSHTEEMDASDEMMLVDYLKHYSANVGILKVQGPLTDKLLRPVPFHTSTLVVGTLDYLISHYGEGSYFKPLYDKDSTVFLPAVS